MDFENKVALITGSGRGIGRAIALHLAERGADIVVNAVSDGTVLTDALEHFRALEDGSVLGGGAERVPAGRMVTPEDIANVVAFLCTPAAEMIRGQVIVVDGGYTLTVR